MRWGMVLIVMFGLVLTPGAGSAASSTYVLWSARTAGVRPVTVRALPADLPGVDARGSVLDRTARRIAVAAQSEVVIEDLDGSNRVVLPIAYAYDGRFSPDGSQLELAGWKCETDQQECRTLSIVDSDGHHFRTFPRPAGPARWLGRRTFAYLDDLQRDGTGTLTIADSAGRVLRVLGRSFAYLGPPVPAPNGKLIADQCRMQTVCVRSMTAPYHAVARFAGALAAPPLWSPDSTRIALTLAGNYTSTTAVGTVTTRRFDRITTPTYIDTFDEIIGWSPNSATILVQRRCSGPPVCSDQVLSEDLATHRRHRLTHDDLKWESVRWTKSSLTYVTPPEP